MLPTIITHAPGRRSHIGFDLDRFFDDVFETPRRSAGVPADLFETEERYGVELELPGYVESDIDVTVDRGVLTVTANRETESEEDGKTYHVRERRASRLTRSFKLPASVRADEVNASLADGILSVSLPKAPEAQPRQIEVGRTKK
ncbi:MAG: Hsp20/alpha crystallin family protein [Gemmatimonadetes bacterium]|nr:Hsp20/alpha crystallin family protein [Gemmatimonadota bacterium]